LSKLVLSAKLADVDSLKSLVLRESAKKQQKEEKAIGAVRK